LAVPTVIGLIHPDGPSGHDRVRVECRGDVTIVAIADGAGGISGGAAAAELACELACSTPIDPMLPLGWATHLSDIDQAIAAEFNAGETTLVVVALRCDTIVGAAAGDSVAWLVRDDTITDLTITTPRKPLLGSGAALPQTFGPVLLGSATLLLATDGLWKYAPRDQLACAVRSAIVPGRLDHVVDLARLRSGTLQDDVAAALIRSRAEG
jgi:serine/threonine protein phosphatase PrpC